MKLTLKAARVNKGYTQKEAALFFNISQSTLANWEKGKTFPKIRQVEKIEKVYGVNYDELIFLPAANALSVKKAIAAADNRQNEK